MNKVPKASSAERGRPLRDYMGFVAWITPAALMATFAMWILVPRMAKVIEVTRAEVDEAVHLGKLTGLFDLLTSNLTYVVVGVTGLLVACELGTKWWPRHRRTGLGIVAWVLNLLTLIGLALIGTIALALALL